METLFRRYLWVIDLVVIAICASLLGLAAAGIVAMNAGGVPPPTVAADSHPPKPERQVEFDKQPKAILERNIFCSSCPSVSNAGADSDAETSHATEAKTSLPLALLAIMYAPASSIGNLSVAILRNTDSKSTGAFAVGGKILGALITQILETRIYLDLGGTTEYLDLLEAPAPPPVAPAATPKNQDPFSAVLDRGTKKRGEHHYEIQRGTLESVLENVALLPRSLRAMPEMKNGKMSGFRLLAIHPDGPLAKIGMQSGDIISSINGLELTSTGKAVEAFGKLKSASHLSLRVQRGDQKLTNEYDIK